IVRLAQALDVFVAVAREANLDLIFAVPRERVRDPCPAARPDRQPVYAILLGEVRAYTDRVAARGTGRPTDGQTADPLCCRNISLEKHRREVAHRHIVKPET